MYLFFLFILYITFIYHKYILMYYGEADNVCAKFKAVRIETEIYRIFLL